MARPDTPFSTPVPNHPASAADVEAPTIPLRLTVARGALGLELDREIALGPLSVTALSLSLPGLRFPLDLSGGVHAFLNRRGDLEQLELRLSPHSLATYLSQAAEQVMGALERPPTVWARPAGVSVGLASEEGALAFDLLWAPEGQNARVVVANARGAGLEAPALGYVLRLLDTAFSSFMPRKGRVLQVERAAEAISRSILPSLGARAPAAGRVQFGDLKVEAEELFVALDSAAPHSALGVETVRALELASLAQDADMKLVAGDLDSARAAYLDAMERAPRHPDLARIVAEIDASVGGRAEGALGVLIDSVAATQAGAVGAELLARVGDIAGAREAVSSAASSEPYGPVAAMLWARLAGFEPPGVDRLDALDRAIARAPTLIRLRWWRLEERISRRDLNGATADAEHLEAATRGASNRHAACRRAARLMLEAGQVGLAGRWFERALRYMPDDPTATAGLARAFMEANRPDRAVSLLERAVALSERKGTVDDLALLDLARVLAGQVKDLPAAIARLSQVPSTSPRVVEARAMEGRLRAQLGDLAGASLAYAQMREAIELMQNPLEGAKRWLMDAGRFEEDYQRDSMAAERHLALALRLDPQDEGLKRRYRRVARRLSAGRRPRDEDDEPLDS